MQVSHHATDEAEHNLEALADFVVDLKIVDVEEDEDGPELEQRQNQHQLPAKRQKHKQ